MKLIPRDSLSTFDNLFDNFFPSLKYADVDDSGFFAPSVDIEEQDDHFLVTADLPGCKKEDISVTLENGVLTLEAKREEEKEEKKKGKVIRRERRSGSFMRSFTVGNDITEADIAANFKNGVLTLTLPKPKESTPSSRRIEVH